MIDVSISPTSPDIRPLVVRPLSLVGRRIRLEPLGHQHHADLCRIGLVGDLFRWYPALVRTPDEMTEFIAAARSGQADGCALPFVIIDLSKRRVAGTTGFTNIDRANRRLEIGWTWCGLPWRDEDLETEARRMLLTHAFETLRAARVAFQVDRLDIRTCRSIERLGATREGVLRGHVLCADGRRQDSVVYAILDGQWPEVRASATGLDDRAR